MIEESFERGVVKKITNVTSICLIPEKKESLKIGDFRPISLVTSLYKIIAKVLSLRFKSVKRRKKELGCKVSCVDFGVNSNLVLFKINKRLFQYFVLKIKQTFFKK